MDNPLLFALFAFLTLMVGLTWVGYRLYYKPGRILRQLGAPVITEGPRGGLTEEQAEQQPSVIITVLTSLGSDYETALRAYTGGAKYVIPYNGRLDQLEQVLKGNLNVPLR